MQSGGKDNTKVVVTLSHVGEGCHVDRPPYIWTKRPALNLKMQHAQDSKFFSRGRSASDFRFGPKKQQGLNIV